jgi:hypothetical protein
VTEALDRAPWYFVDLTMAIEDARLVVVHRHWQSLREGANLPAATRFDPLDLAPQLGLLFMVRVEHAGDGDPVLRYSLIGTQLVEALGRDTTGRTVAETFPPDHPVDRVYRHLLAARVPVRTHGRLDWVDKAYRRFESILLPLAGPDGRIAKVLGAAAYT